MSIPKGDKTIPSDARERAAWVIYQLSLKGTSLRQLGKKHGWTGRAVGNALRHPSFPQEQAIAAALGMDVKQLFPERYDSTGRRLHQVRAKATTAGHAGHRLSDEAA